MSNKGLLDMIKHNRHSKSKMRFRYFRRSKINKFMEQEEIHFISRCRPYKIHYESVCMHWPTFDVLERVLITNTSDKDIGRLQKLKSLCSSYSQRVILDVLKTSVRNKENPYFWVNVHERSRQSRLEQFDRREYIELETQRYIYDVNIGDTNYRFFHNKQQWISTTLVYGKWRRGFINETDEEGNVISNDLECWQLVYNKQILKVSLKQPSCLVEKVGRIRKVCRNDSKQIRKVLSVIDKDVYMNISQIISTIKSLAGNVKHEIFIDPVPDKPNTRKVNIVFRDLQTDDDWLLGFKAELRKRCEKEKFPYIILKNSKSNYSDKVYPRIVMTMNMNQGE